MFEDIKNHQNGESAYERVPSHEEVKNYMREESNKFGKKFSEDELDTKAKEVIDGVKKRNDYRKLTEKVNKIADLIEKNIDKFDDYKWSGDAEDVGIIPEVAEAFDAMLAGVDGIDIEQNNLDGRTSTDEVEEYKDKLKKKGYKVLDLKTGDDSYWIVGLKPENK